MARGNNLFGFHLDHYQGDELRGICAALRKRGLNVETRGPGVCHLYVNANLTGGILCKRTRKGWTFKRFGTVTNGAIEEIHRFVLKPATGKVGRPEPRLSRTGVQKPNGAQTGPK
jgi:hypothetical protein